MPKFLTMDDFEFEGKVVLVRVDFNSPVDPQTKKILDDTRIRVHAETTLKELVRKGAKIVILAHQGRPGSPDFIPLEQHAGILAKILGTPVEYVDDLFGEGANGAIRALKKGKVLVLKNVRTYPDEEKKGSPEEHAKSEFIQKLAPLADIFISDAFAAAHRPHASIVGFTVVLPSAAGRVMERELKALNRVMEVPEKPCIYVFGGAKADDSLKISRHVLTNRIADRVLTGGVIGHLFLAARGFNLGKPNIELLEKEGVMGLVPGIRKLMEAYPGKIEVPIDLAVEVNGKRKEITVDELPISHPICDIGKGTIKKYDEILRGAKSIVVSGPMGVYENREFLLGTKRTFEAVASSKAFSLIGGGHTVAATKEFGLTDRISYVSTAGGALIEFLMGEQLPGVVALEKAAAKASS